MTGHSPSRVKLLLSTPWAPRRFGTRLLCSQCQQMLPKKFLNSFGNCFGQLRWVAVALDSDSSAKWVHFARYWLGRQLAKRPEWLWLNSNSLPHADPSLRPPAYSNIWTYLGEVKQWVLAAPIVDFTVRKVYS